MELPKIHAFGSPTVDSAPVLILILVVVLIVVLVLILAVLAVLRIVRIVVLIVVHFLSSHPAALCGVSAGTCLYTGLPGSVISRFRETFVFWRLRIFSYSSSMRGFPEKYA